MKKFSNWDSPINLYFSALITSNKKRSAALLSRQSSGESTEDGLAVLAMAAASRAFDSDQSSPPSKKSKYGQLGLEDEDDEWENYLVLFFVSWSRSLNFMEVLKSSLYDQIYIPSFMQ